MSPPDNDDGAELSDSENELDETTRAAKRRRIAQLGRDYLEGKELTILTASLKGPFENGWANPWKKDRSRDPERVGATDTRKGVPDPKPAGREHPVSTQTEGKGRPDNWRRHRRRRRGRTTSERAQVPESDPDLKRRTSEERDPPASHRPSSAGHTTTPKSKLGRTGLPPDAHKTKGTSESGWLKKDGKGLHHKVTNPPKSPSPTPEYRPRSRQKSGTEDSQNRKKRRSNQPEEVSVAAFTPVNGPNPHPRADGGHSASASVDGRATGVPQNRKTSKRARKGDSGFSKPVAPASATTGPTPKSGLKGAGSASIAPATAADSGETHAAKRPMSEDATANALNRAHDHQTQTSIPENMQTSSAKEERTADGRSFSRRSNLEPKPSSGGNSGNVESARTESDNITSAQVVPGKATFPDAVLSLGSTEDAAGPHTGHDANDPYLSTQPPLVMSQDSAQDNLASPANVTPVRPGNNQSAAPITPFHTFQSPECRPARDSPHATGRETNNNSHAEVSSYDASTSKKAQFGSGGGRGKKRSSKKIAFSSESPTDNRRRIGPSDAHAQENIEQPNESLGRPHGSANSDRHMHASAQGSPAQSAGTVLPFALSASTNGTKQQDGQGAAGLNNFDLNQAIVDAGSFLQSWDIDRDLSLQSHRNGSASVQTVRPATELKEASQG